MSFERIVVGVDGSPEGTEALRQALRLLAPGGRLVAVTAFDPVVGGPSGWGTASLLDDSRADAARDEAARALAGVPGTEARVVDGAPIEVLLATAAQERADLLAVGSHGASRLAGILLGSVATAVVHDAPCPVLVARAGAREGGPVVVGLEGSETADRGWHVGRELAVAAAVPCRPLAATGGKALSLERLRDVGELEWSDREPVEALVDASRDASLVVVGSRGLHGLAALGSVSERVAHRAACSVLVLQPNGAVAERADAA